MTGLDIFPRVDLGSDTDLFKELVTVWRDRQRVNRRRSRYFDGEQGLKDFGISIPPKMKNIGAALGWAGKGIRAFTNRSRFEEFATRTGANDPFSLSEIMDQNRFQLEFPAACISSSMHGCSFLAVTAGDQLAGEPEVLVSGRSAEDSAALWDARRRALRGALSILEYDAGEPTAMVMYTPEKVWILDKKRGKWVVKSKPHPLGEVPVYPLVHGYELRRPLGHSRISRSSMYFVDAALRTIMRSEVSSEFYSAVEYWLFGADVADFVGGDKWQTRLGSVKAMDVDQLSEKPDLHRFNGASPQPHIDQMRMWANLFADEMDLEVKFADTANPSSAEAIFASKETQIVAVKDQNLAWGYGAADAMRAAIRLRDSLDSDSAEMAGLKAVFTDPELVSPSARADMFSKFSADIPGFSATRTGLRMGGFTGERIDQLQAELRQSRVSELVNRLRSGELEQPEPVEE